MVSPTGASRRRTTPSCPLDPAHRRQLAPRRASAFPPGGVERLEIEPARELWCGAFGAEGDLEAAGDERQVRLRLGADDRLEVAPEPLLELAPLQVGELEPGLRCTRDRLGEALAQELERLVEPPRRNPFGIDPPRQA